MQIARLYHNSQLLLWNNMIKLRQIISFQV